MEWFRYERYVVLQMLRERPDIEASQLAKEADCSWDELFAMDACGLIVLGANRLQEHACHPVITEAGLVALSRIELEWMLCPMLM